MRELIDRAELLAAYDREHKGPPGRARELIKEAPIVCEFPETVEKEPGLFSSYFFLTEEDVKKVKHGYQPVMCCNEYGNPIKIIPNPPKGGSSQQDE